MQGILRQAHVRQLEQSSTAAAVAFSSTNYNTQPILPYSSLSKLLGVGTHSAAIHSIYMLLLIDQAWLKAAYNISKTIKFPSNSKKKNL